MNQPYKDTEKIWAPDGIQTHDPPCSWSRTRRFVGSNPIWGSNLFCVLVWLIFFLPLFFLLKGLKFLIYPKLSDVFILLSWVIETTTTRKQIKHDHTLQQMCFVRTIKSVEGFF